MFSNLGACVALVLAIAAPAMAQSELAGSWAARNHEVSKSFQPDPNPMSPVGPPCVAGYEGVPEGTVPHFLPGTNPSVDELTKLYGNPREATLGGAETVYPEYRKKLKETSCGRKNARGTAGRLRRLHRPRARAS